ncbi:hypothetical protein GJ697_12235 [Pseudoduganella sp. FT25W]|uniref:Uncharacterized protein n=1 Tax=Duganella alba TaxID=2666081 RepID=A0A6L5QFY8_9BURK|nr:hypothetical protein [Duganella alba]MRX08609.1 hypothetical protein [Duganella alba]MRX19815.1 hypothetical protein [Duganella alba]
MTEKLDRLHSVAADYLALHIKHAGDGRSHFRATFSMIIEKQVYPVLMLGTADGRVQDGDAVAILNPDVELLETLGPIINQSSITESVTGKCDGMAHVHYEAYIKRPGNGTRIGKYAPRAELTSPKFDIT